MLGVITHATILGVATAGLAKRGHAEDSYICRASKSYLLAVLSSPVVNHGSVWKLKTVLTHAIEFQG
jgi:hypothetical protein